MYYDYIQGSKSSIFFLILVSITCVFYIKDKIIIESDLILKFTFVFLVALAAFYLTNNIQYLFSLNTFNFNYIYTFFVSFFNRIGFLDYFLEKNVNYIYSELFDINYNLKSFLDKITPGFDPYGIPLMKNQMHYLAHNDELSYSGVVSEQSTVFALFNRMFEKFYFVLYFLVLLIFNKFYYGFNFLSKEKKIISQIFILLIFYEFLNGFGFDQFLMISLYYFIFVVSLFLLASFFKIFIKE
tara:strand:+ start:337 stop:1059 length:723 start_codon:yes stop_codon:yes gene_type:complete